MNKSCREIEQTLVDYADGQLSPGDSNKVAEHLTTCEHCRKMLNGLQKSLELAGVIWADSLSETENIRIPISRKVRKRRWLRYAAIAAGILLVVTTSFVWRTLVRPTETEPSLAEIEREIINEGMSAKLLAVADLLASKPYAKTLIKNQYEYIVDRYPNTNAAATARLKIQ